MASRNAQQQRPRTGSSASTGSTGSASLGDLPGQMFGSGAQAMSNLFAQMQNLFAAGMTASGTQQQPQQRPATAKTDVNANSVPRRGPVEPNAAADLMTQLYNFVQSSLPNQQVLGAMTELARAGLMDPNTLNSVTSTIFTTVDLGPAIRNMDVDTAASAVKHALEDPNLVGALAQFFKDTGISAMVGNRNVMLLLLHVVTQAAAPQLHAMATSLCTVAGAMAKDEVGKKVIDAAVTKSRPEDRAALLKALDIAHVDPAVAAPVKEILLNGLAETSPEERTRLLSEVFPGLFDGLVQDAGPTGFTGSSPAPVPTRIRTQAADSPSRSGARTGSAAPAPDPAKKKLFDDLVHGVKKPGVAGGKPLKPAVDELWRAWAERNRNKPCVCTCPNRHR